MSPIYIGTNRPDVTSYTVGSLTSGLPYRFTLYAINDNGYSAASSIVTYYACEPPSNFAAPTYVSSDQVTKTITIAWTVPGQSGGCAVTGYNLYYNAGDGTDPTTEDVSMTTNDPNIFQHTITLSTGTVGNIYKFKVKSNNEAGSIDSSAISVALASLPDAPASAPTSDATVTNAQ